MKLIFAVISDDSSEEAMAALNEEGFGVTKLCSTGGFLKVGNTTILVGTEAEKVDIALKIVKEKCKDRKHITNVSNIPNGVGGVNLSFPTEFEIGGATVFVLNVERFEKL